jgi:hypothetical protein
MKASNRNNIQIVTAYEGRGRGDYGFGNPLAFITVIAICATVGGFIADPKATMGIYILFAFVGAAIAIARFVYSLSQLNRRAKLEWERQMAAYRHRADYENQQYAQDGIYEGQYPAETMPNFHDYDDGMDRWQ